MLSGTFQFGNILKLSKDSCLLLHSPPDFKVVVVLCVNCTSWIGLENVLRIRICMKVWLWRNVSTSIQRTAPMLVQPKHIENQIHCRNIPPSLYGSSFAFKRYKQFHFNTLIYVFVRKRQFAFQTYILAIASFLKYFLMSSFYSHKLDEQCQY